MRVRFLQRCGAYHPGADPMLDADEAARVISMGVAEPFDKPPAVDVEAAPDEPTDLEPTLPAEEQIEPTPRRRGRRS